MRIGSRSSPHGEPRALDVTLGTPSATEHTSRPSCTSFPRRVDTELFHLAYHARNLIELESLLSDEAFHGARPLTDDYAPVDVLAAGR